MEVVKPSPSRRTQGIRSSLCAISCRKTRLTESFDVTFGFLCFKVHPTTNFDNDLKHVSGVVKDAIKRDSSIMYVWPEKEEIDDAQVITFSDAGYPYHGEEKSIAQEVCSSESLTGLGKEVFFTL